MAEAPDDSYREPWWGNLVSLGNAALLLGGPLWVATAAVAHFSLAGARVERLQAMSSGLVGLPGATGPSVRQLWLDAALDPALMLYSAAVSGAAVAALLTVLAVGVLVAQLVGVRLGVASQQAAWSRYDKLVDHDATLSDEAWSKNLPEPDEPSERPPS